jgi:hypothetical protein
LCAVTSTDDPQLHEDLSVAVYAHIGGIEHEAHRKSG